MVGGRGLDANGSGPPAASNDAFVMGWPGGQPERRRYHRAANNDD
jgi:hypothetical protein